MKKLYVATGRPYEIIIDRGILNRCGEEIRKVSKSKKAMIISDSNVFPIYGEKVVNSMKEADFEVFTFVFEAGEHSKKLETIYAVYNALADNGLTRGDLIVALGGGVTGDMSGFAAATYLRGIDFVQIPTSLLSQVDSSVGGKTGVDIPQGKNLVGAFWQPNVVLIDPDTLNTLTPNFFADGMGEVIKYGCIKSAELFETLEKENAWDIIEDVIYECVKIKRDVVQNDERDHGERALLNFGHTLGHAIEKEHNFKDISHGQAVAVGMVMMTKATEMANLTPTGTADRIAKLCEKYNLPTTDNTEIESIVKSSFSDKKSSSSAISLIILDKIGESRIYPVAKADMLNFVKGEK
ncbi:MAG: 3-dehydroquinate synthase [Acutalibacteraceae bacterium]|nr:3-dehydroquinate synthase [Acutalibacteraceae bacterium]